MLTYILSGNEVNLTPLFITFVGLIKVVGEYFLNIFILLNTPENTIINSIKVALKKDELVIIAIIIEIDINERNPIICNDNACSI